MWYTCTLGVVNLRGIQVSPEKLFGSSIMLVHSHKSKILQCWGRSENARDLILRILNKMHLKMTRIIVRHFKYVLILMLLSATSIIIVKTSQTTVTNNSFTGKIRPGGTIMVKNMDSKVLGMKGVGRNRSHTQLVSPRIENIVSDMPGRRKQENDVACCKHEFCKDNVPPKRTKSAVPGPIHFCIAAGESGILEELKPLLKSLVLHAKRKDVILHILTGNESEKEIKNMLERIPDTPVKFMYDLVRLNRSYIISESLKNNIAISHHSGLWGMSKAYMHEIFKNVKKCIVLDVDTVFGTDPAFLWDEFSNLEDQQLISMRITDKSEKYTLINSGVMLQDFEKMRKIHFSKFYLPAAKRQCSHSPDDSGLRFRCSDQALAFGIFKNNNSHLFQTLQVCWNLEKCLGFGFFKFQRYIDNLGIFFGLVHLNCLRGENNAVNVFLKDHQFGKLNEYLNYLISVPLENICSA